MPLDNCSEHADREAYMTFHYLCTKKEICAMCAHAVIMAFPASPHNHSVRFRLAIYLIANAGYMFLGDVVGKNAVFAKTTTSRVSYAISRVRKMEITSNLHTFAGTNL